MRKWLSIGTEIDDSPIPNELEAEACFSRAGALNRVKVDGDAARRLVTGMDLVTGYGSHAFRAFS